jgi:hypothetical protein
MPGVGRVLRVVGWSLAALVLLIGAAGAAAYAFVTSDYVRGSIEKHADALSGRRTTATASVRPA